MKGEGVPYSVGTGSQVKELDLGTRNYIAQRPEEDGEEESTIDRILDTGPLKDMCIELGILKMSVAT
jgi:hypothetical protein